MIQVICRAMKIIELLGTNPSKEFTVTEISGSLKLDKGTCTNILKTLASGGFVQQSGPRSGYKLGYELYKLTTGSVDNDKLTKIAREDIERLGSRLNETALLSVIRNDKRIVLYSSEHNRSIIIRTPIGKSIYSANTGRVILANYTPAHMEKFIIRVGLPNKEEWPEVFSSDNPSGLLHNYLMQIRQDGYSTYEDSNGILGIAAPLFQNSHVVGSVGVYLPVSRLESKDAVLRAVLETANTVNRKIELYDK